VNVDLGDVVASFNLFVKGHRPPRLVWHIGAPVETTSADRVIGPKPSQPPTRREATVAQIHADKKVTLTATPSATDEVGNPTTFDPADVTVAYTVDDPSLINLTDNGDGTAVAAATGALGTAQVTATATHTPTGRTGTDVLTLEVVPGDAEIFAVSISVGPEEEVTPDEPPTP